MMNFKFVKSLFIFSKVQRTGIFTLLAIIVLLQIVYVFVDFNSVPTENLGNEKWLAVQSEIDGLKLEKQNYVPKIYPFNPNFITDYKGYKLGMSVQEIDRLLAFRKQNKYVNSATEFQQVTQVSDSLLTILAPYFKFPDWVKNKKQFSSFKKEDYSAFAKKEKIVLIDINNATSEDLIKIYGIGDAIAQRILKYKESIGGFVAMEQLTEVWGLSPEVIENLNKHFKIFAVPHLTKIDVNNASIKELAQFPYFKYTLAKQIVTYRSMNGDIHNIEDLAKIKGFPVEKAKIISLYLDF